MNMALPFFVSLPEKTADLVQVYTGLIYEGPALVAQINEAYVRWKSGK